MIEKISKDVLDKLNATPSRDFCGMVGIEIHLMKVLSLLDLDDDGVKMHILEPFSTKLFCEQP
ncbi:BnaC09g51420D [Brassica napus]|uniref:(rape) hypothetical protein n=1 Tax=Brassica napus TaxID=3708 RepID=A0A078ITC6_BRANA|nr:unnamed protein product [Brassica napus]CDY52679.1 BnaC09g51420D [Brassica napus]